MKYKLVWLMKVFAALAVLAEMQLQAYTVNKSAKIVVTDGSQSDTRAGFSYAIKRKQDGWVVTVGAAGGTYIWSKPGVMVSSQNTITLQGASPANRPTILIDATGGESGLFAIGGRDGHCVTVKDFIIGWTNHPPGASLLGIYGEGCCFRLTDCTFVNAASSHFCINIGAVASENERLGPFGVIDHCQFYLPSAAPYNCINVRCNGDAVDASWRQPMSFGTTNSVVVEACAFSLPNTAINSAACVESDAGARWTFRYNNVTNMSLSWHGVASGAKNSTLQTEIYENSFNYNDPSQIMDYVFLDRGGSSVIWSNTVNSFGERFNTIGKFWAECASSQYAAEWCSNQWTYPVNYPGWQQVGQGSCTDGIHFQTNWPSYVWGNTVPKPIYATWALGIDSDAAFIVEGRDIFTSGKTMPGYTPLVYPHPLDK